LQKVQPEEFPSAPSLFTRLVSRRDPRPARPFLYLRAIFRRGTDLPCTRLSDCRSSFSLRSFSCVRIFGKLAGSRCGESFTERFLFFFPTSLSHVFFPRNLLGRYLVSVSPLLDIVETFPPRQFGISARLSFLFEGIRVLITDHKSQAGRATCLFPLTSRFHRPVRHALRA